MVATRGAFRRRDETTYAACVREVAEETFLKDIESDGVLFDIDIHLIPTNKGITTAFPLRYTLFILRR
jgi:ADP-ribose pyrophosphatase YjhB (NUDIX family)